MIKKTEFIPFENNCQIAGFRGDYAFLSNFYASVINIDGLSFQTVEHAFQAAKSDSRSDKYLIIRCRTPAAAKLKGRRIALRRDWEQIKLAIMENILRKKFQNPCIRRQLFLTGNKELIEYNNWGDRFWGQTNDGLGLTGANHLGRLLVKIRDEQNLSKDITESLAEKIRDFSARDSLKQIRQLIEKSAADI